PPSPGPILTTSPDSTSPYTLSLHAALPIYVVRPHIRRSGFLARQGHHARHSLRVQQVQGSPLRPVLLQRAGTAAAGNGRRGYLHSRGRYYGRFPEPAYGHHVVQLFLLSAARND